MKKINLLSSAIVVSAVSSALFIGTVSAGWWGHGHDDYGKGGYHHGGKFQQRMFSHLDDDGKLSLKEREVMVDNMFSRMDDNDDGVISQDEMPNRMRGFSSMWLGEFAGKDVTIEDLKAQVAKHHKADDTDNDGLVSPEELEASTSKRFFDMMDTNKDGKVSFEEYQSLSKLRYAGKGAKGKAAKK